MSCFLREYGDELMQWKNRKKREKKGQDWIRLDCCNDVSCNNAGRNGNKFEGGTGEERYSDNVFVAPMVHPRTVTTTKTAPMKHEADEYDDSVATEITTTTRDEFDFVDDGEDGDDLEENDEATCLTGVGGNGEEDEDGYYFTNTCGAGNCTNYGEDSTTITEGKDKQLMMQQLKCSDRQQLQQEVQASPQAPSSSQPYGNNYNGSDVSELPTTTVRKNTKFLSPKLRRRKLLSLHSWTSPVPSESQCYTDIQSAYTYLVEVEQVSPKNVILYGKSVGSGPTTWLAQKLCVDGMNQVKEKNQDRDDTPNDYSEKEESGSGTAASPSAPGGVILHSPFLSVIRVVLDVGFTPIGDLFPNVDRVRDFS